MNVYEAEFINGYEALVMAKDIHEAREIASAEGTIKYIKLKGEL